MHSLINSITYFFDIKVLGKEMSAVTAEMTTYDICGDEEKF